MKICKHSNCAVCTSTNETEREVLKYLFKDKNPEVFICKNAMYRISSNARVTFDVTSLYFATQAEDGSYFIRDMFSPGNITLTKENVTVMCSADGECEKDPS